jgi:hypothetical protein
MFATISCLFASLCCWKYGTETEGECNFVNQDVKSVADYLLALEGIYIVDY